MEDLPNKVEVFDEQIHVELQSNSHGFLNREKFNADTLERMIWTNRKYNETKLNTGFLLMLSKVTISVIIKRKSNYPQTLNLAVLDSHARDKNGRVSSDGVSVLMFFLTILAVL